MGISNEKILRDFIRDSGKKDIKFIRTKDVEIFLSNIEPLSTKYQYIRTGVAIRGFIRYFHARKSKVISPEIYDFPEVDKPLLQEATKNDVIPEMKFVKMNRGRPPCIEQIRTVKRLCDVERMTYEEVGKILKKNKSSICRWYHYDLDRYEKEEMLH